jgi:hypothetical protein
MEKLDAPIDDYRDRGLQLQDILEALEQKACALEQALTPNAAAADPHKRCSSPPEIAPTSASRSVGFRD